MTDRQPVVMIKHEGDGGDGCCCSIVFLAILIVFVLFAGEPDIQDGIVAWLMGSHSLTTEKEPRE